MTKLIVKTGTEEDFFKRGRQLAKVADHGERLPDERIISFEDPADVMKLITSARLALFRSVKKKPGSITEISERLHRDRSAVKRDVDELERAGQHSIRINDQWRVCFMWDSGHAWRVEIVDYR